MSRGVNHVHCIGDALKLPGQTNRLALNSDSTFALNVHAVQVLGTHVTIVHDSGELQHAVSQR